MSLSQSDAASGDVADARVTFELDFVVRHISKLYVVDVTRPPLFLDWGGNINDP